MKYTKSLVPVMVGLLIAVLLNSLSITNGANSFCTKQATSDPNSWCFGTQSDDGIAANGLKHNILGLAGDDRIDAGSGDDGVCGGPGNDRISGGEGSDEIFGDVIDDPHIPVNCGEGYGADRIIGGPGDDRIYHGLGTPETPKAILSDGHKDFIDCGPGDDSAWINTSVDHDIALNCEHVHAG